MPVRKAIAEKDGVYFITFTCTNWLPLFTICSAYDAVYNWFNHLKQEGHYIIGYIIMPSHVHAVIAFSNTGKTVNSIVSNGKRFIAYDLVKRLQQQNKTFCSPHLSFPSPQCLFFKAMCASKDIAAIGAQKLIQFLNFNSCLFAKP